MKGFLFALLIMMAGLCTYMLEDSYGMITSIRQDGWERGAKETVNNLLHSEVFDLSEKDVKEAERAVEGMEKVFIK